MGCFRSKPDPFKIYCEIVKNKKLDSTNQLVPSPSFEEKQCLLDIIHFLPLKAQDIIYSTCVDNGAGTGIFSDHK